MNRRRIISGAIGIGSAAIGLVLFGGIQKAQGQTSDQNTDSHWDGPGYYAEDLSTNTSTGQQYLFKEGGPFASDDACQAYLQQYPKENEDGISQTYQCVYRGSNPNYTSSDGCFLTTACIQHAGLPDDCEELTVMRTFRDGYLSKFEEGRLLIDHYYRIAPRIVERIHRAPDRGRVLDWVLREVRATAGSIGRGESDTAIMRYAAMVLRLQQYYTVIN